MGPSILTHVFGLTDLFLEASRTPTFITMIEADMSGRSTKDIVAKWAGGIKANSKAPFFGPNKAFTLLAEGDIKGFTKTPLPGSKEALCQYAGGTRKDEMIISCSGWHNDKIDLMLALLLQWSLREEVRFHHVGYNHETEESFRAGMAEDSAKHGSPIILKPASDHRRGYIKVKTPKAPNGMYWIEHQFFSNPEQRVKRIHWDFATTCPIGLIRYIAVNSSCLELVIFIEEQNSPSGMVKTMDQDGTEIAIMARPSFTDPETW